MQTHV
ncbi:hypothetical protein YPPY01_4282, partial [Yersinia pestis PY-01]